MDLWFVSRRVYFFLIYRWLWFIQILIFWLILKNLGLYFLYFLKFLIKVIKIAFILIQRWESLCYIARFKLFFNIWFNLIKLLSFRFIYFKLGIYLRYFSNYRNWWIILNIIIWIALVILYFYYFWKKIIFLILILCDLLGFLLRLYSKSHHF